MRCRLRRQRSQALRLVRGCGGSARACGECALQRPNASFETHQRAAQSIASDQRNDGDDRKGQRQQHQMMTINSNIEALHHGNFIQ